MRQLLAILRAINGSRQVIRAWMQASQPVGNPNNAPPSVQVAILLLHSLD